MWIRTQPKLKIVNSDQVIDIFISKTGKEIYSEVAGDGDIILLGTYDSKDTCMKILDDITEANMNLCSIYQMPEREKVND